MLKLKLKYTVALIIILSVQCIAYDPLVTYKCLYDYYYTVSKGQCSLPLVLYIEIFVESYRMGANPYIIIAISNRETGFKNVISPNGEDSGFMQINRAQMLSGETAKDYLDVHKNVCKGIKIYLSALKKAKGDEKKALAYYNAGENFDLSRYTHWEDYAQYIIDNKVKSTSMCNLKISN